MKLTHLCGILAALGCVGCSPNVSAGSDILTRELSAASLSCGGAPAYQRTKVTSQNHCLWWSDSRRDIPYAIDNAISSPAQGLAIFAAFSSWNTAIASCSDMSFTHKNVSQQGEVAVDDTLFVILRTKRCSDVVAASDACWSDDSCDNVYRCWDHAPQAAGVTTATYSTRTGELIDADVELNGADFLFTTVDSPACPDGAPATTCVSTDIQATLTHEIGHVVGLDHVSDERSLMFPTASPGELAMRVIDSSSACFVCETYPKGLASRDCRN